MKSAVLSSLLVTAITLAAPLQAQVPRRLPAGERPVLVPQAQPATGITLGRLDDAAPPTNLRATPSINSVALIWSAAPGATGYAVLRSLAAAGPFEPVTPSAVADTQFIDSGVAAATTYFYQVTGSRPDGHYGTTPPVTVTVPMTKTLARERPPYPGLKLPTAPSAGWGFADLHTHQAANLAFGGGLVWGEAWGPPEQAIKSCQPAHGIGGTQDVIGNAMNVKNFGGGLDHRTGGHPNYDGWPQWKGVTHQQMYVEWLKRAVDGGLRLMVMDAVNNRVFCTLAPKKGVNPTCDDMELVNRQIDEVKRIERFVDSTSGGEGQGWYRIAYNAKQARDAVSAGKLAVVIGIEVDQLFNCGASCTPLQVRQRLQDVYDRGVRKLNPVHLADNGFGGAALYNQLFSFVNYSLNGKFFTPFECSDRGLDFQIDMIGPAMARLMNTINIGAIVAGAPPATTMKATCNTRGLTPVGSFLIHEMMSKHMIIDVAHLGLRTMDATLGITDSSDYPVVASHSSILDVSLGEGRSERALSDPVIAAIRKNGGLIGIGIGGSNRDGVSAKIARIPNDCGKSSKVFAQHYLTAVGQVMGDPVAFGSDINGLETMTAPRFGGDACAKDLDGPQPVSTMISYPFTGYRTGKSFPQMQFGNRTFDFNNDGFAQVGMFPDLIEDLQKVGLTGSDLDPLFRSADAFVRLWEKAESKTIAPLQAIPPTLTINVVPQEPSGTLRRVFVTAKDRETGVARSGTVSIVVVTPSSRTTISGPTGQSLSYSPCQVPVIVPGSPTTGGERERDIVETCSGRVTVAGYPDATFTTP